MATEMVAVSETIYEQMVFDGTNAQDISDWLAISVQSFQGTNDKLFVVQSSAYADVLYSYAIGSTVLGRVTYEYIGETLTKQIYPADSLPYGYRMVEKSLVPGTGDGGGTQTMASTTE